MKNKSASFKVFVSNKDIQTFAKLTGDLNPLHIDPEYAATTNFKGQIAHGALLVGYISRLLGMYIPGERCLIINFNIKLLSPVFVDTKIEVNGSIDHYNSVIDSGRVKGFIKNASTNKLHIEFQVDFSKHHKISTEETTQKRYNFNENKNKISDKSILIIGANGGIGKNIYSSLSENYKIRTAGRNASKNDIVVDLSNLETIKKMFENGNSYESVICLASDPLISSPLKINDDLNYSLKLNSLGVVSLTEHAYVCGTKRLIFFSSTMGDSDNLNKEFASYALGKNILNATLSLLSSKYAGKMEIYNIVLGNMFMGLTAGTPEIKTIKYNLSTTTKKCISIIELSQLVNDLVSGKLVSLSGNKIRFTSGL